MCTRIWAAIVIIIAIIFAIIINIPSPGMFEFMEYAARALQIILPILGVGALIKYLVCGAKSKCAKCGSSNCSCNCK